MATYLVTGIAGFIGSALGRALLRRGHEARGLDNFVTGKRRNLEEIIQHIDLREADLLDHNAVSDACRGVDFVLHQAAIASVPRSIKDPVECNAANVLGTLNLLVAARDAGVQRFIYASSSSLYGDTLTLPTREDTPANPISPYAVSKLAGELYAISFYRSYGLRTVALRYFNVFGPRQDPSSPYSGVLSIFISRMLAGERPTIFGDGDTSRDFTFVQNVVEANLLACTAPADLVAGRAFNIATGRRITLHQMFASVKRLTGYSGETAYGPERAGDIKHSCGAISLAAQCLGYAPKFSFEEGLAQTVSWYMRECPRTRGLAQHHCLSLGATSPPTLRGLPVPAAAWRRH